MKANNKKINQPQNQVIIDDDETKAPKDAIEITDNEDYDYENNPSHQNLNRKFDKGKPQQKETTNPYKKSKIVIAKEEENEKMKKKIIEQANRLIDLHGYKILCEKRIRQLVPNHPLPVTEADLKSEVKESSSAAMGLIKIKDREIAELKKKISEIESKCQSRTGNESYQKLLVEKEQILDSLRNETLANEEQRNYIEILKQTIESSIVKNGLGQVLLTTKSQFPSYSTATNVDMLVDIAKIKNDADNSRKELVNAQVLISELKQEIEFLKKQNEDMSILNERIKENYEKCCSDMEDANKRTIVLQEEKEYLTSNLDDIASQLKNAKETADESHLKIRKYEKDILENSRKINELSSNLENHEAVQKDLMDYKTHFEKLYADYEKLLKEKSGLDFDIQQVKDENAFRMQEERRLKQLLEDKDNRYEKEKREKCFIEEKYDNDISFKQNEITELNREISSQSARCVELTDEIKRHKDELRTKEAQIQELEDIKETLASELRKINFDFKDMQNTSQAHFLSELNYMKENLMQSNENSEILKRDIQEKHNLLLNASFQVDALEERVVLLSKEKKQLEDLVTRVSKSFPNSEMLRKVNDILTIQDTLFQLERDKIKNRNSYVEVDTQQDKQSESSLRMEKRKLIAVGSDIGKKINDKLKEKKLLEEEISKIEMKVNGDSMLCFDDQRNIRNSSTASYRRNKNLSGSEFLQFSNEEGTSMKMDNVDTFPSQDSFQNTRDFSEKIKLYKRPLLGNV